MVEYPFKDSGAIKLFGFSHICAGKCSLVENMKLFIYNKLNSATVRARFKISRLSPPNYYLTTKVFSLIEIYKCTSSEVDLMNKAILMLIKVERSSGTILRVPVWRKETAQSVKAGQITGHTNNGGVTGQILTIHPTEQQ